VAEQHRVAVALAADSKDVVFPDPISAQPATKSAIAAATKITIRFELGFLGFMFGLGWLMFYKT